MSTSPGFFRGAGAVDLAATLTTSNARCHGAYAARARTVRMGPRSIRDPPEVYVLEIDMGKRNCSGSKCCTLPTSNTCSIVGSWTTLRRALAIQLSFLDGASHPEDLVERAVELGYQALAVTDHDGFYGAVRFSQAARDAGLPAVYGVEIGLEQSQVTSHKPQGDPIAVAERRDRERTTQNAERTNRLRRGRNKRMHGSKPIEVPPTDHLVLLAGSPKATSVAVGPTAQFRERRTPHLSVDDLSNSPRPPTRCSQRCHSANFPRRPPGRSAGSVGGHLCVSYLARFPPNSGSRIRSRSSQRSHVDFAGVSPCPTVATNNVPITSLRTTSPRCWRQ